MTLICLKQYLLCLLLLYRMCDISKSSCLHETWSMNSPSSQASGKLDTISAEKSTDLFVAEDKMHKHTKWQRSPGIPQLWCHNVRNLHGMLHAMCIQDCLHCVLLCSSHCMLLSVCMRPKGGRHSIGGKIQIQIIFFHQNKQNKVKNTEKVTNALLTEIPPDEIQRHLVWICFLCDRFCWRTTLSRVCWWSVLTVTRRMVEAWADCVSESEVLMLWTSWREFPGNSNAPT